MEDLNAKLQSLSRGNDEYAKFNKRIVNTSKQVLGVRMPDLRKLARSAAKNLDAKAIEQLLGQVDCQIYEQVLLVGLMINTAPILETEQIKLTKKYLKLVDSWAEIDSFAEKRTKFNEKLWWDFATDCLKSPAEFTVRYGIIFMMTNFLTADKIGEVFASLRQISHNGYYVKMGQAWFYATAAVKFYKLALAELENPQLDSWTVKKAYQKMLESRLISDEQKINIRQIKKLL